MPDTEGHRDRIVNSSLPGVQCVRRPCTHHVKEVCYDESLAVYHGIFLYV